MDGEVRIERDGAITVVRMWRPEKKNALTADMYAALADALEAASASDEVRVVVIAGAPGAFTAGNDLADFLHRPPRDRAAPVFRFIDALPACPVPVVAAVDGPAAGIGTTMLLHCDLVYASTRTRFVLPFVNLALVPEAGSSLLLPRLAGLQRASELLMLGEPFDAARGAEIGLVNAVCEPDAVEATALAAARKLAAKPRAALRATKALLRREPEPVAARIDIELAEFDRHLDSPHAREAFSAFLQRRPPDFDGLG